MNYAYVRVSTRGQTIENQRFGAEQFCKENNIVVDTWICETVSGTKKAADRKLGELIKQLKKGDTLIVTELSRLGRSFYNVIVSINSCIDRGVRLLSVKGNYDIKDDIQSKVIVFALTLAAEIERDLISQRTVEGLKRRKAEGVILGRRKGRKSDNYKLTGREDEIRAMIAQNKPVLHIANELKIDRRTVSKFIKSKIL